MNIRILNFLFLTLKLRHSLIILELRCCRIYEELSRRGIKIKAANMYGPLRDFIRKTKLEDEIVDSELCLSIEDCLEKWESETKDSKTQCSLFKKS